MKVFRILTIVLLVMFLASCVSAPAPAPEESTSTQESAPAESANKKRAKDLVMGEMGSGSPSGSSSSSRTNTDDLVAEGGTPTNKQVDTVDESSVPQTITPEEEAFLNNYLAKLQYMVYYDEAAGLDPNVAKTAVNQANRYLLEKMGLSVVDFDQIEKNKKDQITAYESETGGSIDLIQYIAQKYNADVYVEISFSSTGETAKNKFYATAQGSMKIYDTSTAELLGSVSFQSPKVMSNSSIESAASNAVAASVWNVMPKMVAQTKNLVKTAMSNGIRYEVIIQNTPDSRQISNIRRALGKQFREIEQVSYAPGETRLNVYTFKSNTKVEDGIYDAADNAGMSDIYLLYSRGKSFTFNSGL